MREKLQSEMYAREGHIACRDRLYTFKAPWLDPKIGIYTPCSYRHGESGQAKVHERRRVCIYQAQVVWICLVEDQIRETTVDVTLLTSFGSEEILEFEETIVAGIVTILNKYVTVTPPRNQHQQI